MTFTYNHPSEVDFTLDEWVKITVTLDAGTHTVANTLTSLVCSYLHKFIAECSRRSSTLVDCDHIPATYEWNTTYVLSYVTITCSTKDYRTLERYVPKESHNTLLEALCTGASNTYKTLGGASIITALVEIDPVQEDPDAEGIERSRAIVIKTQPTTSGEVPRAESPEKDLSPFNHDPDSDHNLAILLTSILGGIGNMPKACEILITKHFQTILNPQNHELNRLAQHIRCICDIRDLQKEQRDLEKEIYNRDL